MTITRIESTAVKRACEELLTAFCRDDVSRALILEHFPSADRWPVYMRDLYDAAIRCLRKDVTLNAITISAVSGVPADDLIFLEYEPRDFADMQDFCRIVSGDYKWRSVDELPDRIRRSLFEDGPDRTLASTYEWITDIQSDQDFSRPNDGESVLKSLQALLDDDSRGDPVKTGLTFLDVFVLGIAAGDKIVVLGPYKGRKSSVERNIVLGLALRGMHVAVFLFEASREEYMADLIAMIANLYLLRTGQGAEATLFRRRLMNKGEHKTFSEAQHKAILRAREILILIGPCLHFYDTDDNITEPLVLESKIRRDAKARDVKLAVIDNGSDPAWTNDPSNDRANAAVAANFMASVSRQQRIAMLYTWQLRESEQETNISGAGAMGGTAIPAKADYVTQVRYDRNDPDHMYFEIRRSRLSDEGARTSARITIDKFSGMMLSYAISRGRDSGGKPIWGGESELRIVPHNLLLSQPHLVEPDPELPKVDAWEKFPDPMLDMDDD
jgi:hypothetical protein